MLDENQIKQAAAEGWGLVTTFENGTTKPLWDIARKGARFPSNHAAALAVTDAAKRGGKLPQQALPLVHASRLPTAPKAKK